MESVSSMYEIADISAQLCLLVFIINCGFSGVAPVST